MSNVFNPTYDQQQVLDNKKDKAIVSASAGTGKTATIIQYISKLIQNGYEIGRMLVVTFTNNAANEIKDRILQELMQQEPTPKLIKQIDDVLTADISTVHSYLQKIIKRNIDKLQISENFALASETKSAEIREQAFKNAYLKACLEPKFETLILSMRKEEDLLKDIVNSLEKHFSVQADRKERKNYYKNSQDEIFEKCEKYLNKTLVSKFRTYENICQEVISQTSPEDKNYNYLLNYKQQLSNVDLKNTFKQNIERIFEMDFKKVSSLSTLDDMFLNLKESVTKLVKECKTWDINCEEYWIKNPLICDIYDFYDIYIEELKQIKKNENLLDFDDLEKYALKLLEDKEVLEEIQKDFDYVFMDEYQDTNPVQERIIKLISKNTKFMTVGDPKQGIYGFRNATSQIMKDDILDMEKTGGGIYYLHDNFRSDPKILKFVNNTFVNIMFESNTGVDYKKTSMFTGGKEYEDSELPAVRIDVLDEKEEEREVSKEKIYDIFNDELKFEQKHKFEAEVIATRINEILLSKIYDPNLKIFRDVEYKDITILVRKRSELVERILEVFAKNKIPVISTINSDLFDCEEVEILLNLLKVVIDPCDDISLASVMASKLGGYNLEQLTKIRKEHQDKKYFYEAVMEDEDGKKIFEKLENFKILSLSKGVKFAFDELFAKTDYYSYLLSKKDGISQKAQVEKFLEIILGSGYCFDIPSLVNYLQIKDARSSNLSASANAVSISTIHASKGLEYPIVILAGMGEDIQKRPAYNNAKFNINNDFGLGLLYLDFEKDMKCKNIVLSAIRKEKERREFVDEIMLLYVAMTRAKNHLYIVGDGEKKNLQIYSPEDVFNKKTYLDLILSGLKNRKELEGFELNYIDTLEKKEEEKDSKNICGNDLFKDEIENYLNFNYKFLPATKLKYKNSVTSLNESEKISQNIVGGSENLEIGNVYHKALEILDFDKIEKVEDIKPNDLEEIEGKEFLDPNLIFKNISLIKDKIKGLKVFKERQFTMKLKVNELLQDAFDEEIMVQGIIDLFAMGEKNILIDYKYSNIQNEEILKDKYQKQLKLYKFAIEKAYKIKINEIYLLSLKYGRLMRINL